MGRPHCKDGYIHTSKGSEEKGEKTSRMQEKGNEQLRSKDLREVGFEKIRGR